MTTEADLIKTYLAPLANDRPGAFGLRDDAALLSRRAGYDTMVSTDPIREGIHFFFDDPPGDVAWKALAVNVSDIVAKGGTPVAYTMALSFPALPEPPWLAGFAAGLSHAQTAFGCGLIGGDIDHAPGPLSIAITMFAEVPEGRFVRRTTAEVGDCVFVTGSIGDAALGLALRRDRNCFGEPLSPASADYLVGRYLRPQPRLASADLVRAFASAAIDISDGVMQDLARIADGRGLEVPQLSLPLSTAAREVIGLSPGAAATCLEGGDYEVAFSVPDRHVCALKNAARQADVAIAMVGLIGEPGAPVHLRNNGGELVDWMPRGFDHFRR